MAENFVIYYFTVNYCCLLFVLCLQETPQDVSYPFPIGNTNNIHEAVES